MNRAAPGEAARRGTVSPEALQDFGQGRATDFLQFIPHAHGRLVDVDQAPQVDGRADDHQVGGCVGNRLLQLRRLLGAIAHGGQDVTRGRVLLEGVGDRAHGPGSRIDNLGRPMAPRGDPAGAVRHLSVRQSRAVFHDQYLLAPYLLIPFDEQWTRRLDDHGIRVQFHGHRSSDLDLLEAGGIYLVDHDHVGHSDVGFARVVPGGVIGSVRIDHRDVEIGLVEREVVVPSVPDDHVGFLLGLPQDRLVIHARVHDATRVDVGLVLLPLLDRDVMLLEVLVRLESLDGLGCQVSVRHRVTDGHDLLALSGEDLSHPAARLALSGAGARRADGDQRFHGLDHRVL